jgi:hypothetical protein
VKATKQRNLIAEVVVRISLLKEIAMKKALLIGATAAILGVTGVAAAELPTFELQGFPTTALQVAVIGGANVGEQTATPSLTLGDMPASPHQIAVLTPRHRVTAATEVATIALPAR